MYDKYIKSLINGMTVKKRSDGRFESRITVFGKRKSFYGSSKADVKTKVRDYLEKVENGYQEVSRIKLHDYAGYWLKTYKLYKVEMSTYTRLVRTYYNLIDDKLGMMSMAEIQPRDIQRIIDEYASPSNASDKALARSGLKRIVSTLKLCFDAAVMERLIKDNPCSHVVVPTETSVHVKARVQKTLSDHEIAVFKEAALQRYKSTGDYKNRNALVCMFILNTGLRAGEALALKWSDFDFKNSTVHIARTVQSGVFDVTGKHYSVNLIKEATKTACGNRVIKLNAETLWYVNEIRRYDERHNINCEYLCATEANTCNTHRNLTRSLYRMLRGTELEGQVSLHTLRHTFGSVLIRRGIGVEVVSKLMGHANINITYAKYIHVIQEQQAAAMELISIS